jgi:membrane fusion protein (multidrug efflux system)
VVTSGVKDGDRIVVDGFQKLQVGKPVSPVEVILDENGVAKPVSAQPVADAATTTAKPQVTAEAKD